MKIRVCAGLLVVTALLACNRPVPPAAANLEAALSFKALWWGPAQMAGLNPDSPPPKTSIIELERWEYTDPIGVPHPDSFDLVLSLSNRPGAPAVQVNVQTVGRWKVGPQSDEEKAVWNDASFIDATQSLALQAGDTREMRTKVDLAQKMEQLRQDGSWPWELSATVTITNQATGQILATVSKNLPIRPGD